MHQRRFSGARIAWVQGGDVVGWVGLERMDEWLASGLGLGWGCRTSHFVYVTNPVTSDCRQMSSHITYLQVNQVIPPRCSTATRNRPPRCHARLPGDCLVPVLYRCVCPGSGRACGRVSFRFTAQPRVLYTAHRFAPQVLQSDPLRSDTRK